MLDLAEAGFGLAYAFEPLVEERVKRGALKIVLEPFVAVVQGVYLFFPSRSQASPALRAFVDVARQLARERNGSRR
jgi:DNA-binding transcriptional LysR family regulator